MLVGAIVLASFGSSSLDGLRSIGSPGRWVALVALAALGAAGVAALLRRSDGSPLRLPDGRPYVVTLLLLGLMLVSAAWSVDGAITVKRAVSFGLAVGATGALGIVAATRPALGGRLLLAVPVAAVLICLAGVVYLIADSEAANQTGVSGSLGRFRGIGENPNTVPILCTIALPLAARACTAGPRSRRVLAILATLLLYGQIVYSGSRGALLGGLVGLVVTTALWPAPWRHRAVVAAGILAAYVGLFAVAYQAAGGIGTTATSLTAKVAAAVPVAAPAGSSRLLRRLSAVGRGKDSDSTVPSIPPLAQSPAYAGELEEELGQRSSSGRSLFGTSGRSAAWSGAISQGNQRPLLGFGFGTEEQVFFDRYFNFQGGHAESSYVGMYLQLGAAGLALLFALIVVLGTAAVRTARSAVGEGAVLGAAAAGAVAGGFVQALVQSFVYSAGNVGTVALWMAVFALAAAAAPASVGANRAAGRTDVAP